jgi:hypothetical protein
MPSDCKTPDEIFVEFDEDDSGSIDKSELMNALRAAGVSVTLSQVDNLMKIVDTDGDGKISKSEFRAFVGTSKVLTTTEVIEKMESQMLITSLRSASTPTDAATAIISSNRRQREYTNAEELSPMFLACLYPAACLLCIIGLALLVAYIYGVAAITGQYLDTPKDYKGKGVAICEKGNIWVSVLCISALSHIALCNVANQYRMSEDPGRTGYLVKFQTAFNVAFYLFNIIWCIYGCTIFYNTDIQTKCEKEMWNFGYSFIICYFVAAFLVAISLFQVIQLVKAMQRQEQSM